MMEAVQNTVGILANMTGRDSKLAEFVSIRGACSRHTARRELAHAPLYGLCRLSTCSTSAFSSRPTRRLPAHFAGGHNVRPKICPWGSEEIVKHVLLGLGTAGEERGAR